MQTLSYTKDPEKHIGLETFMLPLAVKKWSDVAAQRMVQLTGMTFHWTNASDCCPARYSSINTCEILLHTGLDVHCSKFQVWLFPRAFCMLLCSEWDVEERWHGNSVPAVMCCQQLAGTEAESRALGRLPFSWSTEESWLKIQLPCFPGFWWG